MGYVKLNSFHSIGVTLPSSMSGGGGDSTQRLLEREGSEKRRERGDFLWGAFFSIPHPMTVIELIALPQLYHGGGKR